MSRRKVTPEELALWKQVAKTTEKLELGKAADLGEVNEQIDVKNSPKFHVRTPVKMGVSSQKPPAKNVVLPTVTERINGLPIRMDKKAHQRMTSGKLAPEARLDLHGLTLAQAQPRLTQFILKTHAQKKRLVLVITGKGKNTDDGGPIPVRHGVLRHAVPDWLNQPPLSPLILQITQAHARHGGGGAYYVYLRRTR